MKVSRLGLSLIPFLTPLVITGCFRNDCHLTIAQSVSVVENQLGPNATLSFCKGGRDPGVREVKTTYADEFKSLLLNEINANDRTSRYDGSCEDNHLVRTRSEKVAVALTTKSFSTAKLCYANAEKTEIALVQPSEVCPAGTVEQAAPIDDCSAI